MAMPVPLKLLKIWQERDFTSLISWNEKQNAIHRQALFFCHEICFLNTTVITVWFNLLNGVLTYLTPEGSMFFQWRPAKRHVSHVKVKYGIFLTKLSTAARVSSLLARYLGDYLCQNLIVLTFITFLTYCIFFLLVSVIFC